MKNPVDLYAKKIIPLLARHRVSRAAFFGSLVDGRFHPATSDIDVLIDPPQHMSLLGFVALKQDMEDATQKDVDLVSYRGLSPYLKRDILSEARVFYEAK